MELRFDRVEIAPARKTAEGYILDDPILTRTGVFEYRNPDGSIRREYRPPEAVFAVDSLAAYEGLPITDGHPGKVSAANVQKHLAGTVMQAARKDEDGQSVRAPVRIYNTKPIEEGKKELSVGYEVELDLTPGVTPEGERYDAKQISVKPNHLALCRKGRAGTARLNLDAAEDADEPERKPTMDMVKVTVSSGLSYDAAPEVANHVKALQTRLDELTAKADTEKARADSLDSKTKEFEAAQAKMRQDARNEAMARVKLESILTTAGVKFNADAKDGDLQVAFIKHVRGDSFDMTGKSEAYIQAAYDLAIEDAKKRADSVGTQRRQMNQDSRTDEQKKPASAVSARQAMIDRTTGQKAA